MASTVRQMHAIPGQPLTDPCGSDTDSDSLSAFGVTMQD